MVYSHRNSLYSRGFGWCAKRTVVQHVTAFVGQVVCRLGVVVGNHPCTASLGLGGHVVREGGAKRGPFTLVVAEACLLALWKGSRGQQVNTRSTGEDPLPGPLAHPGYQTHVNQKLQEKWQHQKCLQLIVLSWGMFLWLFCSSHNQGPVVSRPCKYTPSIQNKVQLWPHYSECILHCTPL